jgi:type I restriction enzyme S subunit
MVHQRGIIKGSTIGPMFYCGFKAGDILFVTRNPHLRKCAVVDFDGICSEKTFVLATKDPSRLLQEYLALVMQSDDFWNYCEENKSGGVNFFLNWSTLADYEFSLPSIEEQKILADKLWAAYRVKESYRQLLASTDDMVKAQFNEMFGNAKQDSINEFVDTIWGSSPASEFYNDNGEGMPFYQGKTEFGDMYIGKPVTYCTVPVRTAKAHSILMSVRAPVGDVNIATEDCCIGRGLASITPKAGKASLMFIYFALKSKADEIARLGTGSTIKAINKDSYATIKLPVSSLAGQEKFAAIATQAEATKASLRQSIDAIDRVIRSLINQ